LIVIDPILAQSAFERKLACTVMSGSWGDWYATLFLTS